MRCSDYSCKTFYLAAVPLPHQHHILTDSSHYLNVLGAYGSGKTYTTYMADLKHSLITPNGETLIGADTLVQLENTIRKDLERDLPEEFVKQYNRQKNMITLINLHIIYWRHLAEIGDIRSYNLSRAHVVEASEVKYEAYVQLQSRIRNDAAIVYYTDANGKPLVEYDPDTQSMRKKEKLNWIQLVTESNPDANWIKDEALLKSGKIHLHYETDEEYRVPPADAVPFMTSHIIPTKANTYLPQNFYENMARGKPEWWIRRFLKGSFRYSEGLVYPNWQTNIVPDFQIPPEWPRLIGFDYGLSDNSHFVFGALDLKGEVYGRAAIFWYSELVLSNMSISQIAKKYREHVRRVVPPNSVYTLPRMDPISYATRTRVSDKKTIGTLLKEEGCYFLPGEVNLDYRILHLNDLIDSARSYFFEEGFKHTNKEALEYKFPPKSLEKRTKKDDKPVDIRNHGVNAVEFITSKVSRNLKVPDSKVHQYTPTDRPAITTRLKDQWNPLAESSTTTEDNREGPASLFPVGGNF